MAIIKKNIYSSTAATNAANLYNFLLEHAVPDYFDSVKLAENGLTVSCYVGELEFLKISLPLYVDSSTDTFSVTTSAGKSYGAYTNGNNNFLNYAYKCNNGVSLKIYGCDQFTISIVKNNEGKTAVIFPVSNYTSGYKLRVREFSASSGDNPTNRVYVVDVDSDEIAYISGDMKTGSSLTGIVPLPVTDNGERYTPNAFLIAYAQSVEEGVLDIKGVKYLSNGQWCIKDE